MRRLMIAITTAACFCPLMVFAQQTNNYELRAVPATGTVTIDGKLGEWDLSGQILCCYDLAAIEKTHSVRVAAMYDGKGLYLACHFKDRTPLVNHIDPKLDPSGGWKADAVQVRIRADQPLHVTAWYYTDRQQPAMSIHYGMWDDKDPDLRELNDALAAGAEEAFVKDADGQGYVQEIALPWKLITHDGRALKSGEHLQMGLELFWGSVKADDGPEHRYADLINPQRPQRSFFWTTWDAWGTLQLVERGNIEPSPSVRQLSDVERQMTLLYQTEGPVPIPYEIPFDAGVTLVIEKPDGTRVKNLIGNYPRRAGANTDFWDGTDDNGHVVSPGEYRLRGLYHKDLDVLYDFAYGNPGNPPYDDSTGRGGWLSNHMPPMAVAAGKDRIYATAAFAEGATAVLAVDYEGQRQWGIPGINGGMAAEDGQYLYLLVGGPTIAWGGPPENEVAIVRIDAASGKYAPWGDGKSMHTIATVPPSGQVFAAQITPSQGGGAWYKPNRPEGELVESRGFTAAWCQRQTMGIALAGGKLYASLYYQNQVVVVDPEKGSTTGQIAIDHPAGLATDGKGNLFAISGRRVVRLTGTDQWTEVVGEGLSAPVGLACDSAGNLYVSDWADAMCVKVFAPDGHLLRTIGKVGGRSLSGAYDPSGMFRPWGIAVDGRGRLWVAEHDNTPRRISVWDANSGAFLREFCGTTHYAAMGAFVNSLRPRQAFVLGNVCELDWEKGLWRVTGTLFRRTAPGAWFDIGGFGMAGHQFARRGDRTLLLVSGGGLLCVAELHDQDARLLAAAGSVYGLYHPGEVWPDLILHGIADPDRLAELQKKHPKAFDGSGSQYPDVAFMLGEPGVRQYFIWGDQNGDGLVQEGEVKFFSPADVGGFCFAMYWTAAVDLRNLTIYSYSNRGPTQDLWKLPVHEWNSVGAPIWELADVRKIVEQPLAPQHWGLSEWADAQGNLLMNQLPLQMFSPQGRLLWSYPNYWPNVHGSHTAPAAKRGRLIGPLYVLGSAEVPHEVGEVFCLAGNVGERYFITTDGLFLASVFADCRSAPDVLPDEPRRGMSINSSTAGGEPFGGEFFRHPENGKYYLGGPVATCREASVLAEVTGLDSTRRLPTMNLAFSEQQHAAALEFQAQLAIKQSASKVLTIARAKAPAKDAPDWGLFDLGDRRLARWSFDAPHSANATWTYDDKYLYLAFQSVRDDTPMINGGADVRTLFKTGDAVEFELRTRPEIDDPGVIEGDLRLVISVCQGQPVAVLYRYKVPGTKDPVPFSSPVGSVKIDQVVVLEGAKIAIDRGNGEYSVRASIPLADLGFAPRKGATYRGDFGVVYSDKTGKIDELRMYWANPANAMVNDLFSEAQINPAAWGRFTVEE